MKIVLIITQSLKQRTSTTHDTWIIHAHFVFRWQTNELQPFLVLGSVFAGFMAKNSRFNFIV
jgi:hypothetical protein